MRDPARAYRELAVRGASPVGLIVILYEEIVKCLRRALNAVQRDNVERRTLELSHAVQVIGYLQSVLDYENGGTMAQSLSHFYNAARSKILQCSGPKAQEVLEALATEFSNVKEGWQQIDRELGQQEGAEPRTAGAMPATILSSGESRRERVLR